MNQALLYSGICRRFARQKVRTLLLMLGVAFGVFVLTSGLALASGFRVAVTEYFAKTFLPDSITLATDFNAPDATVLTEADVAAVLDAVPALQDWAPLLSGGRVDLERNGVTQRAGLTGTNPAAQRVFGQGTVEGEYIGEDDVRARARVALIGNTIREKLFPGENPVGQTLTIGAQVYTVKGVLEKLGGDPHGGDLDNVVTIPYTTLQQINRNDNLPNVRFRALNSMDVEPAAARIRAVVRGRHNIAEGRRDDFYVATMPAGRAQFDQFLGLFSLLLPAVTALILAISTLVIASLMLGAVRERTPEIGLRKAVGARARDIRNQFLVETVLIALLGGVLGIVLSYPGMLYVRGIYAVFGTSASFLPSPGVLAISLLAAGVTGVLAALLPARRAAALAPVEALR